MSIAGAMRSLTVDGRGFKVAHDGSGNKNLGGRNNEVAMNGDKSFRVIQTVMPGSFSDIQVEIDDSKSDLEYLQGKANAGLPSMVVATYAANISYTGDVVLTGELSKDELTGLASLNWQGSELQKI
jgi:hypothetical protein